MQIHRVGKSGREKNKQWQALPVGGIEQAKRKKNLTEKWYPSDATSLN